ncbi:hypothetical protein HPB47_019177, partial [Ixodes persulcatus]
MLLFAPPGKERPPSEKEGKKEEENRERFIIRCPDKAPSRVTNSGCRSAMIGTAAGRTSCRSGRGIWPALHTRVGFWGKRLGNRALCRVSPLAGSPVVYRIEPRRTIRRRRDDAGGNEITQNRLCSDGSRQLASPDKAHDVITSGFTQNHPRCDSVAAKVSRDDAKLERLLQYEQYLSQLASATPKHHPDYNDLSKAAQKAKS